MSLQFVHSHDCSEKHNDAVWGVQWTAKDRLVSASADGSVRQWDATSGQGIASRPPHAIGISSLSVALSGSHALYNSLEGTTGLWDLEKNEQVGVHESYVRTAEQSEPAWAVSLHPSAETYAATGASGNVTIHSAGPSNFGERIAKLESGRTRMGMSIAHSPDGQRLALALETGQVFLFDLNAQALASTYTAHAASVRGLAWSPLTGELLMSASDDRRLTLFDVRMRGSGSGGGGGGPVAALAGHTSWVLSTAFSPDERLALSGSADKTMKVWDIGARAAVSTIQDTGEVWSVCWRPLPAAPGSAGAFASGGEDSTVKLWRSAGTS